MQWQILLERKTQNRLNVDITRKKLRKIAQSAEKNQSLGFSSHVGKLSEPQLIMDTETGREIYRYEVRLKIEKNDTHDHDIANSYFKHALSAIQKQAQTEGWKILASDSYAGSELEEQVTVSSKPPFKVPDLTEDVMKEYFDGIYERDSHIRIIHDSVKSYFHSLAIYKEDSSVPMSRSHVLLKGKPAGCKTTLYERFKAWYESEDNEERVLFVDSQVMTKAGLENFLIEKAECNLLPEIIVFEEIEKQNPDNLLSLVSVMGSGHISKLNARIGHKKAIANVLIWATCNDASIIQNFRNGVLWSRFAHHLHCARPSRDLMWRILMDKVMNSRGNPQWVDKVLEFSFDLVPKITGKPIDDPRAICGLLDGKNRLLDGSYQKDKLEILKSEIIEMEG
jgi:hypothetical protein